MSKEKYSYMGELDAWTGTYIIAPLYEAAQKHTDGTPESDKAMYKLDATIKKLVREKVLESYRNGQAAKKK